jgi:hypothetical protein
MSRALAVALVGSMLAACGDGNLGSPDSYVLLAPSGETSPAGLPVCKALDPDGSDGQALAALFADGFAAEMLRTIYMAKQVVRDGQPGGRPAPAEGKALAAEGLAVVVGLDRPPVARGLAMARWLRGPVERPALSFVVLPGDLQRDKALVQTVSGRLATYALAMAVTAGTFSDVTPVLPPALGDGYRMAMEVVAREWRTGKGPQGVVAFDAGSTAQRELFAGVRENRFVLASDRHTLRPPAELLADPGVAATVLYRMAQSRAIAGRVARPELYQPFAAGRLPPGISPAAVLGVFRNFQAKLLGAWSDAVLRGHPPRDIAELVQVYAAAFPEERTEALRLFVVTTFAATVRPGGVSTRPEEASRALAAIDAAVAEVAAGRRDLRATLK